MAFREATASEPFQSTETGRKPSHWLALHLSRGKGR